MFGGMQLADRRDLEQLANVDDKHPASWLNVDPVSVPSVVPTMTGVATHWQALATRAGQRQGGAP